MTSSSSSASPSQSFSDLPPASAGLAGRTSFEPDRGGHLRPVDRIEPAIFGADRHGANLFGTSIVALDALTGEYAWHFQTVHHYLWDSDNPTPPLLPPKIGSAGA